MITALVILACLLFIFMGGLILTNADDGFEVLLGTALGFFGVAGTAMGFIGVFSGLAA
jgi:hypothetical protein